MPRMKLNKYFAAFFFIILLFSFRSKLISQELITDRPDITESAVTVPIGDLQIEDGFLFGNQ
jgi:hypothetical protein